MKARLRTFFAVIAVALMLACAFAPLVSNGNSVSAESSVTEIENVKTEDASAESILTDMLTSLITGDDSGDMSEKLGQLLVSLFSGAASGDDGSVDYTSEMNTTSEITKANSMAGLGSAAKKYDVWNDAILIPVENTITDYSDLPALTASGVDEGIKAARLYNMTIDKESTTDKLDFSVPYVTIKKGETLVIFPTDASIGNYSFSIKYSTTDGPSYGHICIESGAILNLFGMSFMVIFDDDNGSRLNSLFRIENGQTMTLSRTYDGGTSKYTDSITTYDSKKHIGIADLFNDRDFSINNFELGYKLTKDWDLNDDKCLNALFEYVILQINAITQSSGSDVMIESMVYLKKVDLTTDFRDGGHKLTVKCTTAQGIDEMPFGYSETDTSTKRYTGIVINGKEDGEALINYDAKKDGKGEWATSAKFELDELLIPGIVVNVDKSKLIQFESPKTTGAENSFTIKTKLNGESGEYDGISTSIDGTFSMSVKKAVVCIDSPNISGDGSYCHCIEGYDLVMTSNLSLSVLDNKSGGATGSEWAVDEKTDYMLNIKSVSIGCSFVQYQLSDLKAGDGWVNVILIDQPVITTDDPTTVEVAEGLIISGTIAEYGRYINEKYEEYTDVTLSLSGNVNLETEDLRFNIRGESKGTDPEERAMQIYLAGFSLSFNGDLRLGQTYDRAAGIYVVSIDATSFCIKLSSVNDVASEKYNGIFIIKLRDEKVREKIGGFDSFNISVLASADFDSDNLFGMKVKITLNASLSNLNLNSVSNGLTEDVSAEAIKNGNILIKDLVADIHPADETTDAVSPRMTASFKAEKIQVDADTINFPGVIVADKVSVSVEGLCINVVCRLSVGSQSTFAIETLESLEPVKIKLTVEANMIDVEYKGVRVTVNGSVTEEPGKDSVITPAKVGLSADVKGLVYNRDSNVFNIYGIEKLDGSVVLDVSAGAVEITKGDSSELQVRNVSLNVKAIAKFATDELAAEKNDFDFSIAVSGSLEDLMITDMSLFITYAKIDSLKLDMKGNITSDKPAVTITLTANSALIEGNIEDSVEASGVSINVKSLGIEVAGTPIISPVTGTIAAPIIVKTVHVGGNIVVEAEDFYTDLGEDGSMVLQDAYVCIIIDAAAQATADNASIFDGFEANGTMTLDVRAMLVDVQYDDKVLRITGNSSGEGEQKTETPAAFVIEFKVTKLNYSGKGQIFGMDSFSGSVTVSGSAAAVSISEFSGETLIDLFDAEDVKIVKLEIGIEFPAEVEEAEEIPFVNVTLGLSGSLKDVVIDGIPCDIKSIEVDGLSVSVSVSMTPFPVNGEPYGVSVKLSVKKILVSGDIDIPGAVKASGAEIKVTDVDAGVYMRVFGVGKESSDVSVDVVYASVNSAFVSFTAKTLDAYLPSDDKASGNDPESAVISLTNVKAFMLLDNSYVMKMKIEDVTDDGLTGDVNITLYVSAGSAVCEDILNAESIILDLSLKAEFEYTGSGMLKGFDYVDGIFGVAVIADKFDLQKMSAVIGIEEISIPHVSVSEVNMLTTFELQFDQNESVSIDPNVNVYGQFKDLCIEETVKNASTYIEDLNIGLSIPVKKDRLDAESATTISVSAESFSFKADDISTSAFSITGLDISSTGLKCTAGISGFDYKDGKSSFVLESFDFKGDLTAGVSTLDIIDPSDTSKYLLQVAGASVIINGADISMTPISKDGTTKIYNGKFDGKFTVSTGDVIYNGGEFESLMLTSSAEFTSTNIDYMTVTSETDTKKYVTGIEGNVLITAGAESIVWNQYISAENLNASLDLSVDLDQKRDGTILIQGFEGKAKMKQSVEATKLIVDYQGISVDIRGTVQDEQGNGPVIAPANIVITVDVFDISYGDSKGYNICGIERFDGRIGLDLSAGSMDVTKHGTVMFVAEDVSLNTQADCTFPTIVEDISFVKVSLLINGSLEDVHIYGVSADIKSIAFTEFVVTVSVSMTPYSARSAEDGTYGLIADVSAKKVAVSGDFEVPGVMKAIGAEIKMDTLDLDVQGGLKDIGTSEMSFSAVYVAVNGLQFTASAAEVDLYSFSFKDGAESATPIASLTNANVYLMMNKTYLMRTTVDDAEGWDGCINASIVASANRMFHKDHGSADGVRIVSMLTGKFDYTGTGTLKGYDKVDVIFSIVCGADHISIEKMPEVTELSDLVLGVTLELHFDQSESESIEPSLTVNLEFSDLNVGESIKDAKANIEGLKITVKIPCSDDSEKRYTLSWSSISLEIPELTCEIQGKESAISNAKLVSGNGGFSLVGDICFEISESGEPIIVLNGTPESMILSIEEIMLTAEGFDCGNGQISLQEFKVTLMGLTYRMKKIVEDEVPDTVNVKIGVNGLKASVGVINIVNIMSAENLSAETTLDVTANGTPEDMTSVNVKGEVTVAADNLKVADPKDTSKNKVHAVGASVIIKDADVGAELISADGEGTVTRTFEGKIDGKVTVSTRSMVCSGGVFESMMLSVSADISNTKFVCKSVTDESGTKNTITGLDGLAQMTLSALSITLNDAASGSTVLSVSDVSAKIDSSISSIIDPEKEEVGLFVSFNELKFSKLSYAGLIDNMAADAEVLEAQISIPLDRSKSELKISETTMKFGIDRMTLTADSIAYQNVEGSRVTAKAKDLGISMTGTLGSSKGFPILTDVSKASAEGYVGISADLINIGDIASVKGYSSELTIDAKVSVTSSSIKTAEISGSHSVKCDEFSINTIDKEIPDTPEFKLSFSKLNFSAKDVTVLLDDTAGSKVREWNVKANIAGSYEDMSFDRIKVDKLDAKENIKIDAKIFTTAMGPIDIPFCIQFNELTYTDSSYHADSLETGSGVSVGIEAVRIINPTVSISKFTLKNTYDISKTGEANIKTIDASGDLKAKADSMTFLNEKALSDLMIKKIDITVSGFTAKMSAADKGKLSYTIVSTIVTGSLASISKPSSMKPSITCEADDLSFVYELGTDKVDSIKADELSADATVRYDGEDRTSDIVLIGLAVNFGTDGCTVNAASITADCDLPLKSLSIAKSDIYGELEASAIVASIPWDSKSPMEITGDMFSVLSSTRIPSAPNVEEIKVELSEGFAYSGTDNRVTAGSVSGYLKEFGQEKQDFSINKKGNDKPRMSFGDGTIVLEKGNATFKSGYIPLILTVGKDMVMTADGLSADSIIFEKGAILSGIISLDTSDNYSVTRTISYDGQTLVSITGVSGPLCVDAGYELLFDIGTLGGGKIVAKTGLEIPEWKSEYGTKYVRSSDHKTATYDTGTGAKFAFACVPLTYSFSYEGGEVTKVRYGDYVTIDKEGPVKTGLSFSGWSDGTGAVYKKGAKYLMPSRDVILVAQYVDVTPAKVIEGSGDAKSLIFETTKAESLAVERKAIDEVGEKGSLTIKVTDAEMKMNKKTADGLKNEADKKSADWSLMLSVQKVTDFNDPVKKDIVKDGQMFSIDLYSIDAGTKASSKFDYTEGQTFEVTLNVKVSGKIDDFKVDYLAEDNTVQSVGVLDYVDKGNGTYNVTFECNHCSDYIVTAIYSDVPAPTESDNMPMVICLCIVAVLALFVAVVARKH